MICVLDEGLGDVRGTNGFAHRFADDLAHFTAEQIPETLFVLAEQLDIFHENIRALIHGLCAPCQEALSGVLEDSPAVALGRFVKRPHCFAVCRILDGHLLATYWFCLIAVKVNAHDNLLKYY